MSNANKIQYHIAQRVRLLKSGPPVRSSDLLRGGIRGQSIVGSTDGRNWHDFYPTPRSATEALLRVEKFDGEIWECACGDGSISKVLTEHGYTVKSSDLVNRGFGEYPVDFLLMPRENVTDNIVTNPPYGLAEEFVRTALEASRRKVAMLFKLAFLEGEKRKRMFETTPLARVHVFSKRIMMTRCGEEARGSGMIAFAWFVWEHGYQGRATVGWV